jgi:hypothetical protein
MAVLLGMFVLWPASASLHADHDVLEKRKEISILKSMGATDTTDEGFVPRGLHIG